MPSLDILYLAWNRLKYTEASFQALLENTDWSLVRRLVVIDDASTDGTREYLDAAITACPADYSLTMLGYGSPVRSMLHYLDEDPADVFAKIDNDVAVPPGWLNTMTGVLAEHPRLELLGMEAGMTWVAGRDGVEWDGIYRPQPCSHIGGIGLIRRSVFDHRPLMSPNGRFGWTEFQHDFLPSRAWISPDLPLVALDRLPMEPWASLSEEYVELGWQRRWPLWSERWMEWAFGWFVPLPVLGPEPRAL